MQFDSRIASQVHMITFVDPLVGIGLYAPDEAAQYARISRQTMARWIWGDAKGEAVIQAQLAARGEDEKLVTFLDFVQALAIRSVRISTKTKFPLQKIRKARIEATARYSLDFPLAARGHRIFIFGPREAPAKCEMVIEIGPSTDESTDRLLQLTGKKRGNLVLADIAEPFMEELEFGKSDYAERFTAFVHKDRPIVMDPRMRLGEPYLPSCGYTARALWDAYQSEGGIEHAAKAYGVDKEDVEAAYKFFDYLISDRAA
jgi:uncharacterized protein (DUF433 family)